MPYKLVTFGLLMQMTLIGTLSGCSSSEELQAKYLDRAQTLYDQEDYTKAKLELGNVLQINPDNAEAFYLKAMISVKNGERRSIAKNLTRAIEIDPEHIKARVKLAEMVYKFGPAADEQVMEQVNAVLAIDPANADANILLGMVLYRSGDTEAGKLAAEQVLASQPGHINTISFLANVYMANGPDLDSALQIINTGIEEESADTTLERMKISILESKGDTDGVIEVYNKLIAEYPEEVEFHRLLARYLVSKGRVDEAEMLLRTLIDSKPENVEIKVWLAEFLAQQRDLELAERTVQDFILIHPDLYELRFSLAAIYLAMDQEDTAESIYQYVVAEDGGNSFGLQARNYIAMLKFKDGDSEGGTAMLEEILDIEPENQLALTMRVTLLLDEGDTKAAIEGARSLVKNDAKSSAALILLASAHEANGEEPLALDYFRSALQLDPKNAQAAIKLAALLASQGDTASADRILERSLVASPSEPSIALALFNSYADQSRWEDALMIASKLEAIEGNEIRGLYLKGQANFQRGDYGEAKVAFRGVLEIEPQNIEAIRVYVKSLVALDQTDEAFKYIAQSVKNEPDKGYLRQLEGSLYYETGNIDGAIESYRKLLIVEPEFVNAYIGLAQAYNAKGDVLAALEAYDAALVVRPNDTQILTLKAGALETMGRHKESADTYEAVLLLDEGQTIAANNLAILLVERVPSNESFQRALKLTSGFEDMEIATLLDTRGWVYYKSGDYVNALRVLEQIFDSDMTDNIENVFWYHLGMTYKKLGDKELAKDALIKSLENGVQFSGRKEASAVLQEL
ncbi:MAG: tetratricopeptide repeat protein [Halioglobus sp.]|nr:tetratricopeptide repeat protein [Halioglobus sp.]